MSRRITLERGGWYGWTMYPGYWESPYHSPIRVNAVTPLHKNDRSFKLDFFNLGYAAGVQVMTYSLRTLRREQRYLLAAVEDEDRSVAIVPLTLSWMRSHLPPFVLEVERAMGGTGSMWDAMDQITRYPVDPDRN